MKRIMMVLVCVFAVSVFAQDLNSLTTEQLQKQLLIEQLGLVRAQKAAVENANRLTAEFDKLIGVAKAVLPAVAARAASREMDKASTPYEKLDAQQGVDGVTVFAELVKDKPDVQAVLKLSVQMMDRSYDMGEAWKAQRAQEDKDRASERAKDLKRKN